MRRRGVLERGSGVALLGLVVASALAACSANTPAPPAKPAPTARTDAAAAFDEKRQELIVFGGTDSTGHTLGDTWAYDAHGWHQLAAAQQSPPARAGAGFAFDEETDEDVLVGGHDGATHLDDTWTWNGGHWTRGVALDAPAHDATAVTVGYNRNQLELVLVVCCTTGADARALSYVGDGHHFWNQVNRTLSFDPPVTPGATWLSSAFDFATGRMMLLSPGPPGKPPLSGAYNGHEWATLAPASDFPPGARPRLVEAPDEGRLLALIDGGPGGPAVWRWNGGGWNQISDTGVPKHVVASAVDIRDGEALVLGESGGSATPTVVAWRGGLLQAPSLGGKAKLEPTFGAATPTPTPVQLVKPARDYAPALGELPVSGYHYSTLGGGRGAPLPGKDTAGAADTWEVIVDGPGPKRISVDIYVFNADSDASDFASSTGSGEGVTNAKDVGVQPFSNSSNTAYTWRETVGDGTVEFWAVIWQEGRIAFAISDRDYKGALKVDDALAVARVVQSKVTP